MKFRARKDILFQSIIYGLIVLLFGSILFRFFSEGILNFKFLWSDLILVLILIPFLWAQFSTKYELSEKELIYQSGPLSGRIAINQIKEIVVGKSLWVGLKPAIARNGLIVKYEKYNEIYISPESNQTFVQKILEINPAIKINNFSV